MKTLAESWADRLAELRAVCRENGERLDRVLRSWYERAHRDAWWSEFYYAATDGRELPPAADDQRNSLKRGAIRADEGGMNTIVKGSVVRPAVDGDKRAWSRLRGVVVDVWQDGREQRAEVHWNSREGREYGTNVPVDLLELVR